MRYSSPVHASPPRVSYCYVEHFCTSTDRKCPRLWRSCLACRSGLRPSRRGTRISRPLTAAWFTGGCPCGVRGVVHASVASWNCACWAGPAVGLARAPCTCRRACRLRDVVGGRDVRRALPGTARAEVEDDGLPAQVAPALAVRQRPDDPSEPFSRNYGPKPPARLAGPSPRMSSAEEEALIARAIFEHEMRRP